MRATSTGYLVAFAALFVLPGCASEPPSLPGTGGLPDAAAIKPILTPADSPRPVGAPTEIYTRVARGILTCWFGANGPLKPTYIYHADAEPPSKGGGAVINIHLREKDVADPRSIRAWKLAVVPAPEGTTVEIENFKLPPAYAEPLQRDARRWAAGEEGCAPVPAAGWGAEAAAPAAATAAVPAKKPAPGKPAR